MQPEDGFPTNSGIGKPGTKRQRSNDNLKHMKQSNSLSSAPELQIAIIDLNHALGKIAMNKCLLLEEMILLALIIVFERKEDNPFVAFNGAKWSLSFLTSCIQDIGQLWPNAMIEVVHLNQVNFSEIVTVPISPSCKIRS